MSTPPARAAREQALLRAAAPAAVVQAVVAAAAAPTAASPKTPADASVGPAERARTRPRPRSSRPSRSAQRSPSALAGAFQSGNSGLFPRDHLGRVNLNVARDLAKGDDALVSAVLLDNHAPHRPEI